MGKMKDLYIQELNEELGKYPDEKDAGEKDADKGENRPR